MFAFFGILTLTSTMATAEPNVTPYRLQESCEKLSAATFHRETADDEDRRGYRAHYNGPSQQVLLRGNLRISHIRRQQRVGLSV